MAWLDRIVYRVRAAVPWVYDLMAAGNAALTLALHGRRLAEREFAREVLAGRLEEVLLQAVSSKRQK